jgi:sacsin
MNLAPWLYVIPIDMAPFQDLLAQLGVAAAFTPEQYANLLAEAAARGGGQPLSGAALSQVLSVVQSLADWLGGGGFTRQPAPVLHAPDTNGVLRPAGELVFNDAPWLGNRPDLLFVHSRISHEVAELMGVASFRRLLLAQSADSVELAMASVEAFGQSESLTTRLKHIIDAYADGPGILLELLQNADDAGATELRLMLDCDTHAADSVLSPRMAAWQGPALLAFNDAVFSPADFHAISRIGQDAKLQRPTATGRLVSNAHLSHLWLFIQILCVLRAAKRMRMGCYT